MTRRQQVRSPGSGSILKVAGRNGWRAQVTLPDGRGPSRQFATKRAAEAWIAQELERARSGRVPTAGPMTLAAWMERWMALRVRSHSTKELDRVHWARYASVLGDLRLDQLTPLVLRHFFESLEERFKRENPPLGRPHTLRLTYALLRTSLRDAVEEGLLVTNPMTAVKRPRVPKPEPKYLTLEETKQLLEAVDTTGVGEAIGVHLMLRLGLRRGEALGLLWEDVDLTTGEIRVEQQLQRVPNSDIPGSTHLERVTLKTQGSVRTLAADEMLLGLLQARHASPLTRTGPGSFVVAQLSGQPYDPDNFASWLRKTGQSVGVKVSPHRLRHTAATLMLNGAVPLTTIGAVLGHTDSRTTLIYARVTRDTRSAAITTLGNILQD